MKTIAILTRRADASSEALASLSKPEAAAVWQGLAMGWIRAVHGLQQGSGAALELETATFEEATQLIEALPYVAQKLLDVQCDKVKGNVWRHRPSGWLCARLSAFMGPASPASGEGVPKAHSAPGG